MLQWKKYSQKKALIHIYKIRTMSNLLTIYHRIGTQPALDYAVDRELLQNMSALFQFLRLTKRQEWNEC